jgi:hypothetical protein
MEIHPMATDADDQRNAYILRDGTGNAYLIPRAIVEGCRVPAEGAAELRGLLEQAGDTAGYADLATVNQVVIGGQLPVLSKFFDERFVIRFNPRQPDPAPAP